MTNTCFSNPGTLSYFGTPDAPTSAGLEAKSLCRFRIVPARDEQVFLESAITLIHLMKMLVQEAYITRREQ